MKQVRINQRWPKSVAAVVSMKGRLFVLCLTICASPSFCWPASGLPVTIVSTPIAQDTLKTIDGGSPVNLGWGFGEVAYYDYGTMWYQEEAIIDFSLSGIPGYSHIASATLNFSLYNWLLREEQISVYTFSGESTVQTGDWNKGAFDQSFWFYWNQQQYAVESLDLTAALQSAVDSGQQFLDVQMQMYTTDGDNMSIGYPPNNPPYSPILNLTVVYVPDEPNDLALLVCGVGLVFLYWRIQRPDHDESSKSRLHRI